MPQRVDTDPATGLVGRLTAPNPGLMTLDGTNTYFYGRSPCVIIDPGPAAAAHLAAIREEGRARGGIAAVLLTHSHEDHAAGAGSLGAEVLILRDSKEHFGLRALATPGHAEDHFCLIGEEGACFSGDLVPGRGSTFVPPSGRALIAYLSSLERLLAEPLDLLCPGHGPWVTDPELRIRECIDHKLMRERRLLEVMDRGVRSRHALLAEVWDDVPDELRSAAFAVMTAHLEKLGFEDRLPGDLVD